MHGLRDAGSQQTLARPPVPPTGMVYVIVVLAEMLHRDTIRGQPVYISNVKAVRGGMERSNTYRDLATRQLYHWNQILKQWQ